MVDQTNALCEIRNFVYFLENCLNRKVIDYSLKSLTKPGDNYGSLLAAVDVNVVSKSDSEEVNIIVFMQMMFYQFLSIYKKRQFIG